SWSVLAGTGVGPGARARRAAYFPFFFRSPTKTLRTVLTIAMTSPPSSAGTKPFTRNAIPSASESAAVSHSMSALSTKMKSPSVSRTIGQVSTRRIGRITALTMPNTSATPSRPSSPPVHSMPGTMASATHSAAAVTSRRMMNAMKSSQIRTLARHARARRRAALRFTIRSSGGRTHRVAARRTIDRRARRHKARARRGPRRGARGRCRRRGGYIPGGGAGGSRPHPDRHVPRRPPMPGRQGLILALAAACIPAGCGAGASTHHDGASAALDASSRDSAGIRILELSHTLEAIATGGVRAATVAPDLRVGESDADWLGAPTDVASLGAGRFAVFDRMQKAILLFDSAGAPAGRLGREGGAPGEYHEPLALAAVGDHLVAWQDQPTSTFTVLGPDGEPRATGGASVAGDWGRPRHRMPYLDMRGGRDGPEDLTRRLAAVGDTAFAHLVQVDERQHEGQEAPFSWSSPPAFLIRYGLDARVRDTLAVLAGAPTLRSEQDATARATGATLRQTMWTQPLFSGRPVWAAGNGWLALGHGDSSHVEVRGLAGETLLRVRWPAARSLV